MIDRDRITRIDPAEALNRLGTMKMRQATPIIALVATFLFLPAVVAQFPQPPLSAEVILTSITRDEFAKDEDGKIRKSKARDDQKQDFSIIDRDGGIELEEIETAHALLVEQERPGGAGSGQATDRAAGSKARATAAESVFDRVEHHQVNNDGVSIHYVTLGKGPVVLFLHGFPDFWYSWREQMQALSGEFKTVAMDLRGYNQSDKPEGVENYAMPRLLADVKAVIEDLSGDSVTLVGHDWGGAIAWRFAMSHPKLVNKLVICNLTHPNGYMKVRRDATPEQKANTQYITRFQTPGFEDRLTPEVLAGISVGQASNVVRARYVDAFTKSSAKGMLDYYRAAFGAQGFDLGEGDELPKLSMPVLQFHGLKDTAVDKDGLRDTWNWISADYTLVTIPSSDHWVQRDAAVLVSDTMRWWIKNRP